jgi:hypothetical protein
MALSRFLASKSASVGRNLPTVMDTFRPSGMKLHCRNGFLNDQGNPRMDKRRFRPLLPNCSNDSIRPVTSWLGARRCWFVSQIPANVLIKVENIAAI